MIERPEEGQSPGDENPFVAETPQPGKFLIEEDEDTDVNASAVHDESDGMQETDYLGKSNLRNRDIESEDDAG